MAGPGGTWCRGTAGSILLQHQPWVGCSPTSGGAWCCPWHTGSPAHLRCPLPQRGVQAQLCHGHGLCHHCGCLSPAGSCRETNHPLSGLRHRPRFCLADTKGLRGAGGVGLPAASMGSARTWAALPVLPGVPLSSSPSAGIPRGGWWGPGRELPSPTQQMPVSQSSARRHWPQIAQQGPPPMGQPRRPPEPLQRSREASPSPALACCRSPSADVSATLRGQPACPLASPACPQDPLLTPEVPTHPLASPACPQDPLPAHSISCLPPGPLPVPGVLTCPWHPLPVPKVPAYPWGPCLSQGPLPASSWSLSPLSPLSPRQLPELPSWVPTPAVPSLCPGPHSGSPAHPLPAEPLSSVSSLEVHFDLLDLTELTDMSDQELAEVFADSDEENVAGESPSGERAGPSSACPSVRQSLSRVSPQGCSRRRCHGPGTCARPPGPEHGSRDGTRSTSATRSCRRDPRTPSCPPSGPESPKGCPGPGGRRGHAGGHTDTGTRRFRPLPGSTGARTRRHARGAGAQDRCGGREAQRHRGPAPGPGGPQPRGGRHEAGQNRWPGAGTAVAPGSGGPGPAERGRYRCPPRTHVAALSSGKTDRPTTPAALPVSVAAGRERGGSEEGPPRAGHGAPVGPGRGGGRTPRMSRAGRREPGRHRDSTDRCPSRRAGDRGWSPLLTSHR